MSLFPRFGLWLAILTGLAACQTVPLEFPSPAAHWKTAQGQLQYSTLERSVIGDAVLSRSGTREFQLDFVAGPGLPLMRVRESGDAARLEGVFARGSWQGNPARARGRLASWTALREIFVALEPQRNAASVTLNSPPQAVPAWTATLTQTPGQPRHIRVEFPRTKEQFHFVLTR